VSAPASPFDSQLAILEAALASGARADAIDAIDAALADLSQLRARLLEEIRAYDARFAASPEGKGGKP
jgi:hypothetical protein